MPYANLLDTRPATDLVAVTPADGTDLQWATPIRGFMCGTGGNVSVLTLAGNTVVVTGCVAGQVYQIAAQRINATGTTASGITGLV